MPCPRVTSSWQLPPHPTPVHLPLNKGDCGRFTHPTINDMDRQHPAQPLPHLPCASLGYEVLRIPVLSVPVQAPFWIVLHSFGACFKHTPVEQATCATQIASGIQDLSHVASYPPLPSWQLPSTHKYLHGGCHPPLTHLEAPVAHQHTKQHQSTHPCHTKTTFQ